MDRFKSLALSMRVAFAVSLASVPFLSGADQPLPSPPPPPRTATLYAPPKPFGFVDTQTDREYRQRSERFQVAVMRHGATLPDALKRIREIRKQHKKGARGKLFSDPVIKQFLIDWNASDEAELKLIAFLKQNMYAGKETYGISLERLCFERTGQYEMNLSSHIRFLEALAWGTEVTL
ncbi:MAG: hypothetical protein ABL926_02665 [Novosphingobium sp.]|uniref:hypothetical protein n=1 Tax=Novosphingobium sp. TaxID=1874826 RepID=UPI0032B70B0E